MKKQFYLETGDIVGLLEVQINLTDPVKFFKNYINLFEDNQIYNFKETEYIMFSGEKLNVKNIKVFKIHNLFKERSFIELLSIEGPYNENMAKVNLLEVFRNDIFGCDYSGMPVDQLNVQNSGLIIETYKLPDFTTEYGNCSGIIQLVQ